MPRGAIGFNVQGKWTAYPGVTITVDPSDLDLANQGPTGTVALLATATGFFQPKVYSLFPYSTATPEQYIVAGSEMLKSLHFATKPFAQLGRGPAEVYVVPVNPATPSQVILKDSAAANAITLTTLGWGARFNQTTVTVVIGPPAALTVSLPSTIPGAPAITETYKDTGTLAQFVAEVNGRSGIVRAALITEGTGNLGALASGTMTGGTDGTATTNDWIEGLAALSTLRVNAIHVATADASVWDALEAYVSSHRARGFVGSNALRNWTGISNRTIALNQLIAEAGGLNNPRIMHCGLGMDGEPGKFASARYAALAASLEPSVPMTFKFLDVNSIETRLSTDEVGGVEGLLNYGVSPPMPDATNAFTYRVSRGLSTWTGDDNLYRREQSVLAAVDGIAQAMDDAMQVYIGAEGNQGTLGRIREAVRRILDDATRPTAAIRINSYDPNIVVAFSSDTVVRVTAKVTPIPPVNWINVNLILQRTEIVVSTEVDLAA